jgi:hypothetical protein
MQVLRKMGHELTLKRHSNIIIHKASFYMTYEDVFK